MVLVAALLWHVSMLSAVELPRHDVGSSVVTSTDVTSIDGSGSWDGTVVSCLNVISSGTTPS